MSTTQPQSMFCSHYLLATETKRSCLPNNRKSKKRQQHKPLYNRTQAKLVASTSSSIPIVRRMPNVEDADGADRKDHGITKKHPSKPAGSWYWVLAPDGSYATTTPKAVIARGEKAIGACSKRLTEQEERRSVKAEVIEINDEEEKTASHHLSIKERSRQNRAAGTGCWHPTEPTPGAKAEQTAEPQRSRQRLPQQQRLRRQTNTTGNPPISLRKAMISTRSATQAKPRAVGSGTV